MIYFMQITLLILVLFISQPVNGDAFIQDAKAFRKLKKRIENSIWVVPSNTLIAYNYIDGHPEAISKQTVWVIKEFNEGYFFGDAYTSIDQTPISHMKLIGSVTPSEYVNIALYPTTESANETDIQNWRGKFRAKGESDYFVMQMDNPSNNQGRISHWTYMVRVNEHDYFYQHLPGENSTVSQFLSRFQ